MPTCENQFPRSQYESPLLGAPTPAHGTKCELWGMGREETLLDVTQNVRIFSHFLVYQFSFLVYQIGRRIACAQYRNVCKRCRAIAYWTTYFPRVFVNRGKQCFGYDNDGGWYINSWKYLRISFKVVEFGWHFKMRWKPRKNFSGHVLYKPEIE